MKLAKNLKDLSISGVDLERTLHIKKNTKRYAGKKRVKFRCQNLSRKKDNKVVLLSSLNSPTGVINFNGIKYFGKMHVVSSKKFDSCDLIQETSIESYISTLLSKEMNSSWHLEALKAQAVAARTYAFQKMKSKNVSKILGHESYYDLESSEKHQVSGNFFDTTKETIQATRETKGEVLLSPSGNILPIFFHANCGGRTLRPDQVWENLVEGYKKVDCPNCVKRTNRNWTKTVSKRRLNKFVSWLKRKKHIKSIKISKRSKIKILKDRYKNYKSKIYVDDQFVSFDKSLWRRYFGRYKFPSNNFKISYKGKKIVSEGKGLGHGVGMCQLGALDYARAGLNYKKILQKYFPKFKLAKMYY